MLKKRLAFFIVVIAVITMIAAPAFSDEAQAPAGPYKIGDVLGDDLKVGTMDGKSVTLKSQATTPFTVFQFMTTACSACRTELNKLLELQLEVGMEKLTVIAVAMDMRGVDAIKAYEAKYNYGLTYLSDPTFTVPPRFGLAFTPSFIIVDSSGTLLYQKGGFIEGRWNKDLDKIMAVIK